MHIGWATAVAMRSAWACLGRHRWRSLLTMGVCALGTAGVTAGGVLADAQVAEVEARFQAMGGRLLVVSPNKLPPYPGRVRQLDHFISLTPEDAQELIAGLSQVQTGVPVVARSTIVRLGTTALRVRLIGTTADYTRVRPFPLAHGRFLADHDDWDRIIVLGHAVSHDLVSEGVRPGQEVYLGTDPYRVVGVLEPQGVNFAGEDEDRQVFIPLEAYRRRIANRPWVNHIYLQLDPQADSAGTVRAVKERLRQRHGRWPDQVEDAVVKDFADLVARQADVLTTVSWAVALTSVLLVIMGSVGIATLMLLVVRERWIEIGLRRALGATPADVGWQFFAEGMVLSATGVLAGLVLGSGLAWVISVLLATPMSLNPVLPAISMAISLGAGALACAIPAFLAARLEPSAALRS